jgi:cytoskeletal protein CcmA (bactofilin family)
MYTLDQSIVVKGELRTGEDLTIEGRVDGSVICEDGSVVVAANAHVGGDIIARDITVFGQSDGQLIATEIVDLRPESIVTGQIMAPRFVLNEGAHFHGRVAPQLLEAALRVARFQQRTGTGDRARAGGTR